MKERRGEKWKGHCWTTSTSCGLTESSGVERNFAAALAKYRGVIDLIQDFHAQMRRGPRKNFKYSQTRLRRQLKESGFIP